MASENEFAHGSYGDESGLTFYGPPVDGFWLDRLLVSDRFIRPLFIAVLEQFQKGERTSDVPKIVAEWNKLEGWTEITGIQEIAREDGEQLIAALVAVSLVSLSDIVSDTAVTPSECVRCASAISDFLASHLAANWPIYIEDG
jgi:hypothetical protein